MRTPISGRNIFQHFSPNNEYLKIHEMFYDKKAFCLKGISTNYHYSYFDILKRNFLSWELRGSSTSVEEMMCVLQIHEGAFRGSFPKDKLLDYIEFILNALNFVNTVMASPVLTGQNNLIGNAIRTQCYLVLDRLDAETKLLGSEVYVVYKNDIATVVSNQQPELQKSITDYLAISNRNDLLQKGEILCSLAKALEPKEQLLKDNGFLQLCKDATFLLNKTGARHALDPNDSIEAQFLAMDNSERIKWYDRGFKTVLACMAVLPYLDFKNEINDIKRNG